MKDFIAAMRGRLFKLACRLKGRDVQIGSDLRIFKKIALVGSGKVVIGRNCRIDGMIGSRNFVCLQTINPDARITIGDNAGLYAARIAAKFDVTIGDDVVIEDANIVDTDFHTLDKSRAAPSDESLAKNRIVIGDRVLIGAETFVTKGVAIGDDVITAPFSVVAKSVKPRQFAYGNPLITKDRG